MYYHQPKPGEKVSSIADRIRGSIAIALTITFLSLGANATDQRWQGICVIAGMLYFITSLAYVFEHA
ncbi:MAG: hypothetical protein K2X27_15575 [Candidatus Obscuribacterales bacterium]|nr:hypothetical protein [Candidatus Obscuribacterales bacterium]